MHFVFGAPNIAPMDFDASSLIDDMGGTNKVARLAGVKPPSVTDWRKTGIPQEKLILLAADIQRIKGIPRWELLPKVWHRIWPHLIGSEGAPPAPADSADTQANQEAA